MRYQTVKLMFQSLQQDNALCLKIHTSPQKMTRPLLSVLHNSGI